MITQDERGRKISQLVAKAWSDESFKKKLMSNAAATMKAEGVELPAGVQVRVVEDTAEMFHVVIPPKPAAELRDEDLDLVAGGKANMCCSGGSSSSCIAQTRCESCRV